MTRASSLVVEGKPTLLDGAWGTELQVEGLAPGACPDALNLDAPALVRRVALRYVEAGSQVILTNTFGSNAVALARYGLAHRAAELSRLGVAISRQAAEGRARVFASVGPSGKMFNLGEVSLPELTSAFTEQIEALAQAGAEALVFETFTDLEELSVAVKLGRETGLPVVACMVFDAGKHRDRTTMGVSLEQAVTRLSELGVDVLGANCGRGVEGFLCLCQRLRQLTPKPLWFKPNAGLPVERDGKLVYATSVEAFADGLLALVAEGASFVGGCCGTSPEFIAALASRLELACPPHAGESETEQ